MIAMTVVEVVLVVVLLAARPAHAYLDPGSGSMILQLLLGGIAGLGVILKLYWHKLLALFGIHRREPAQGAETDSHQP